LILNVFLSILVNAFGDAAANTDAQSLEDAAIAAAVGGIDISPPSSPPATDANSHEMSPMGSSKSAKKAEDDDATKSATIAKDDTRDDECVEIEKGFFPSRGTRATLKLYGKALCCIPARSKFRRTLAKFITSAGFVWTMNVLVMISLVTLVMDSYPELTSIARFREFLFAIDIVYLVVFTIEFLLKLPVYGVVGHPGSYLRNAINVLDLIALIIMYIDVGTWWLGIAAIKALRATRPLRLLLKLKPTRVRCCRFFFFFRCFTLFAHMPSVL
jgi:hypothetical protein